MNKQDELIKNQIYNAADNFSFPKSQLEAIHEKLSEERKGEVIVMKNKTFIRIAAAFAIVIFSGSVAFAATKASQWYSWGTPKLNADFQDYEKSAATFDENSVIKELSNGFTFKGFSNGGSEVKDDDGNTLGNGSRIDVTYSNGDVSLMYSIEKGSSTVYDDISSNAATEYKEGDTTFFFHEMKNKFVPTNYKMTSEEEALVEAGKLNVAYGTDEIEENTSQSIYWEKNGNIHSLFGFDTRLSADDFFEMAKELN